MISSINPKHEANTLYTEISSDLAKTYSFHKGLGLFLFADKRTILYSGVGATRKKNILSISYFIKTQSITYLATFTTLYKLREISIAVDFALAYFSC